MNKATTTLLLTLLTLPVLVQAHHLPHQTEYISGDVCTALELGTPTIGDYRTSMACAPTTSLGSMTESLDIEPQTHYNQPPLEEAVTTKGWE